MMKTMAMMLMTVLLVDVVIAFDEYKQTELFDDTCECDKDYEWMWHYKSNVEYSVPTPPRDKKWPWSSEPELLCKRCDLGGGRKCSQIDIDCYTPNGNIFWHLLWVLLGVFLLFIAVIILNFAMCLVCDCGLFALCSNPRKNMDGESQRKQKK